MTVTDALLLMIKLSVFVTVLSFGLNATLVDVLRLFQQPGRLAKALFSIYVAMPLVAIVLVKLLPMSATLETALVALSVSPVPPILMNKALKERGRKSFNYGLLAGVSIISIFVIPLAFRFLDVMFQRDGRFSEAATIQMISVTVLLPILIGMLTRHLAPGLSERLGPPLNKVGMILLLLPFVVVLIAFIPLIFTLIGSGWALVSIVFATAGIAIGRSLGGAEPADRTVLSLASASRHPWVAVALITANVGESQRQLAMAAVIVYVLINAVVAAVYLAWLAKHSDQRHGTIKQHKLA